MTRSKMIKMLLGIVLAAIIVVGAIVFFVLSGEKLKPDNIAAQEEAYKQSWGIDQRIQDLKGLKKFNDNLSTKIINDLINNVGLPEITSVFIENKELMVTTNYYTASIRMIGQEIDRVYIGKSLIYRRLAPDKNQIIIDKVYSYNEYNNIVEKLSKDLKIDKEKSAELYRDFTDLSIYNIKNIKKLKSSDNKDKTSIIYKAKNINTPIHFTLKNSKLDKVSISGLTKKSVEDIIIYDTTTETKETFNDYTVINNSRTYIPDSLAYQIGEKIGATLRFPVAVSNGDDSWIIVKIGEDEYYYEANADVTRNGKTTSEKISAIRFGNGEYSYLKVGKKELIK